jgi:hypothetical protein
MAEQTTKYTQRIKEYTEKLKLSSDAEKAIAARLTYHRSLLGQTIKDIFLCDGPAAGGPVSARSLWVFTNNVASEIKEIDSQIDINFMNHRDVRYAELNARESDFFSVSANSAVTLQLTYAGGRNAKLMAKGLNCINLLMMFRKYFSQHLAP